MQHPFQSDAVAAKFAAYPAAAQSRLLLLRDLVFITAANTPGVGQLQETLKWGEPAYLTARTGAGTTVRMDWKAKAPAHCALYFHCQSGLVDTFRTLFPHDFVFDGQRALVFDLHSPLPLDALGFCLGAALTHHLQRRRQRA